ncbi:BTAD domain-containing putative transcriptional regulator, partial [Spirillospora sp. NPDC049652]
MRFGVLGSTAAWRPDGTQVPLGGPARRALLALLLVRPGAAVSAEGLAEELYQGGGSGGPGGRGGAAHALQSQVSRLRGVLRPDADIESSPAGYRLTGADVDAARFEALAGDGRAALAGGDAARAADLLAEALGLWRGPAFAEFADLPWAAAEAARLDELRRLAAERRAEAMLGLGAAAEAVPDLEAHVAADPLREDAWRLLALALYRSGRQGDALGALRRARDVLTEQLGVDPGPALRGLEADILAQAAHLDAPPRPAGVRALVPHPTAPPMEERQPDSTPREPTHTGSPSPGTGTGTGRAARALRLVPPDGETFVGRTAETALLTGAAGRAAAGRFQVVLVGGEAGIGKTALVERFSRGLAADGWRVAWGRSEEAGGAPAAWSWAEILR